MARSSRRAKLEDDLRCAEAAYEQKLLSALRSCAAGRWGLFRTYDAYDELPKPYRCVEGDELLELGEQIRALRTRLGHTDAYDLHEGFLAARRRRHEANALGEARMAQQLLADLERRLRDR